MHSNRSEKVNSKFMPAIAQNLSPVAVSSLVKSGQQKSNTSRQSKTPSQGISNLKEVEKFLTKYRGKVPQDSSGQNVQPKRHSCANVAINKGSVVGFRSEKVVKPPSKESRSLSCPSKELVKVENQLVLHPMNDYNTPKERFPQRQITWEEKFVGRAKEVSRELDDAVNINYKSPLPKKPAPKKYELLKENALVDFSSCRNIKSDYLGSGDSKLIRFEDEEDSDRWTKNNGQWRFREESDCEFHDNPMYYYFEERIDQDIDERIIERLIGAQHVFEEVDSDGEGKERYFERGPSLVRTFKTIGNLKKLKNIRRKTPKKVFTYKDDDHIIKEYMLAIQRFQTARKQEKASSDTDDKKEPELPARKGHFLYGLHSREAIVSEAVYSDEEEEEEPEETGRSKYKLNEPIVNYKSGYDWSIELRREKRPDPTKPPKPYPGPMFTVPRTNGLDPEDQIPFDMPSYCPHTLLVYRHTRIVELCKLMRIPKHCLNVEGLLVNPEYAGKKVRRETLITQVFYDNTLVPVHEKPKA